MVDGKGKKIIFIVGPTAVGKTAVGIFLAKMLNGEIISCDSMQVYQDVQIANNKPSEEDMASVPHHLIDFVPLTENFDVVRFRKTAQGCIDDVLSRGKIPIIVGGTGMYMKALLDGIFEGPVVSEDVRKGFEEELERKGNAIMHQELKSVDPEAAGKIHLNDVRRILRALEVYHCTGTQISQLQKEAKGLWGDYDISNFGLRMDRKKLYGWIDARVDEMFDSGLLDEIRSIQGVSLSRTAQAIIGIKEVRAYLSGEWALDQAREEMKKNTRRLAKRQLTWFRSEKRLQWIDIGADENAEGVAKRIFKKISEP